MRIYNVDSMKQFKYVKTDYKKSERWKQKASTRKLIYTIGMTFGSGIVLFGLVLEKMIQQIPFPPLPIFLMAILSGCFFGWIPGLAYSKLSGAKCLAISTIEKRVNDILFMDETILRYVFNEMPCNTGKKRGYKMLLEDVESITYNQERQLLTIFGECSWVIYDLVKDEYWHESKHDYRRIEIPMYFEDNEAIIKDLKEMLEKKQKQVDFKYV